MVEHNTQSFETSAGIVARVSRGADRKVWQFEYRDVKSSDDIDVLDDLISVCGTAKPFYMDPPFDTESSVWCWLTENVDQGQDDDAPAQTDAPMKHYTLTIAEHLA
jgi:hypothetical protein